MTATERPRTESHSLRFRIPVLLLLYFGVAGGVLYLVASQAQEAEFERDFVRRYLARATELQSRTERAAERREIETGQREFGELAVFEEIVAAVLVSPGDEVILGSRREWLGRRLDLSSLGLPVGEQMAVEAAMRQIRNGGRTEQVFSQDRDTLTFVLPVTTPAAPGALGVDRGSLMLLVHDLGLAKAVNRVRLRRQFALVAVAAFLAVLGLGAGLHVLVTQRIERLHGAMGRFAAGEPIDDASHGAGDPGSGWGSGDEISQLHDHFVEIAADRRRKEAELRRVNRALQTISSANQVLVHAATETDLLREVCRVIVDEGGHVLAMVSAGERPGDDLQVVMCAGDDAGYVERLSVLWRDDGAEHGPTAEAVREGKPAVCASLREDAGAAPWQFEAARRGFRSVVALPLVSGGERFGALSIYSRDPTAFDRTEVELLVELADDLAFGIRAIRLRIERREAVAEIEASNIRYARQEEALARLTRGYVSSPEDFRRLVQEVTEVSAGALDVAEVAFWRRDERTASAVCVDLYERPSDRHVEGLSLAEAESPSCFRALALADVIAAYDARDDERTADLAAALLEPRDIGAMMALPIRSGGTTVGMLTCHATGAPRRWTADEQAFAVAVANLLSALVAQTERQRLEAQLRQAQKLEAVGQLAGGVAHDFNNILTVILGRTEEVLDDPRLPAELRNAVTDVSQSAERATGLTRQLLAFSRRQAIEARDVDVNAIVGHLTRMLDRLLGEDIVVSLEYSTEAAFVHADQGMLEQVLLNLAVNARDAMPAGGRLRIDTAIVERARTGRSAVQAAGSWVRLRVADSGTGIAQDHLVHIFEPFFTTKDVGKGTGLGLATTYGIVQQHGGWIEVDSEVGRGTEFRVFFPRVAARPPGGTLPRPAPARGGHETILVVEDEDGVRQMVVSLLQGLGYRVFEAPSGPRAIELWNEQAGGVDLLITDVVMPDGLNGIELAARLRSERPRLRVILMSGYLADVTSEDIRQQDCDAYLSKPFSLPELARLVRSTLDALAPPGTGAAPER